MSLIPPLCPKNMYHCKGVSPSLHSWGNACLLLKVYRHCWRCCCCSLKSYTLSPWNYHWEKSLHDTDSLQVRLMGWVAASAANMAEHNHKPVTFLFNVASWLSGLYPKSSLLRRAGHSLGSYSIHCLSIFRHDEQECSLLLQNIGLAFRTSVWAQYNSPFFPPLFQDHAEMQQYLKQTFPSKYFQRGSEVLLERQQWLLQHLQASALEPVYTHNNQIQKHGVNQTCWFIYVHNMEGPSVYHNHDASELACIKLLTLQTQVFYSSVTLRLQQLLTSHSDRPVYCFPPLSHLQPCQWEGWISDREEVGSNGPDRDMFLLDFHVVPLYLMENGPSPPHSEGHMKHLCVFGEKNWIVPILLLAHYVRLGGSDVVIPFYHPHWLRAPACLWWDWAVLAHLWPGNHLQAWIYSSFVSTSASPLYCPCYERAQSLKKFLHWIYLLSAWLGKLLLVVPAEIQEGKNSGASTHFARYTKND